MPKKPSEDTQTNRAAEEIEQDGAEKQAGKSASAAKTKRSSTAKSTAKSKTTKSSAKASDAKSTAKADKPTTKSRATKSSGKASEAKPKRKSSKSASKTTVAQVMTDTVHRVQKTESLNEAARSMWENDVGVVPVVDPEGGLAGIVTDRDIAMAAYLKGRPLRDISVQEVMTTNIESTRPHDTVDRACSTMAQRQIRRVPVVDDDGMLVGILSINDLALASGDSSTDGISDREVAETLRAISVRRGAGERPSEMSATS